MIAVLLGGASLVGCDDDGSVANPPPETIAASAAAQEVPSDDAPVDPNEPTYGAIELTTGFAPDPHVVRGTAGGVEDAADRDEACTGWISEAPDHELVAGSHFGVLYAMAFSLHDVSLVIEKPDGSYACNDNAEGNHPLIRLESVSPGTFRVWVGSKERGRNSAYTLGISELEESKPSDLRQQE
jgi:hypothetical protein